jgi:hypothetical protein
MKHGALEALWTVLLQILGKIEKAGSEIEYRHFCWTRASKDLGETGHPVRLVGEQVIRPVESQAFGQRAREAAFALREAEYRRMQRGVSPAGDRQLGIIVGPLGTVEDKRDFVRHAAWLVEWHHSRQVGGEPLQALQLRRRGNEDAAQRRQEILRGNAT